MRAASLDRLPAAAKKPPILASGEAGKLALLFAPDMLAARRGLYIANCFFGATAHSCFHSTVGRLFAERDGSRCEFALGQKS